MLCRMTRFVHGGWRNIRLPSAENSQSRTGSGVGAGGFPGTGTSQPTTGRTGSRPDVDRRNPLRAWLNLARPSLARRGAARPVTLPRLPLRDGVGNEPLDDPVEEVVEILGRYRVAVEAEPSDVRLLREIEDVERPGRGDGGDRAEPLVVLG